MCGICGFIDHSCQSGSKELVAMTKALYRRGPDQEGLWENNSVDYSLGLGHRRLSILDLSDEGRQPMLSPSGRYQIIFNGEIYNYIEIRDELSKNNSISYRGTSDTEVLLAAIEVWGLRKTLEKSIGMFAIALWDSQTQLLYLARDRMGEKPLYWGIDSGLMLFGSELSSIQTHPRADKTLSHSSILEFLRYAYVPAPQSIFKSYQQVEPGAIYCFSAKTLELQGKEFYWQLSPSIETFDGSFEDAKKELKNLLLSSTSLQLRSDVPVGVFLSGGIDSSLIAALVQSQRSRPISTFTIGFEDAAFDEGGIARTVAEKLKTNHHHKTFSDKELEAIVVNMPTISSEPFADPSLLPTVLLSRMTREKVTVALSGDAGDELFLGYSRYHAFEKLRKYSTILRSQPLACMMGAQRYFPGAVTSRSLRRIKRLIMSISPPNPIEGYTNYVSRLLDPSFLLEGIFHDEVLHYCGDEGNILKTVSALDMVHYLPSDIITKVDRASMNASLEVRIPMLDHRIVDFARSLPNDYCCYGGRPKGILIEILGEFLPKDLFFRKKSGFSAPISSWLRGSIRELTIDVLSAESLKSSPIPWRIDRVQRILKCHLSGKADLGHVVWMILSLELWRSSWL